MNWEWVERLDENVVEVDEVDMDEVDLVEADGRSWRLIGPVL